MSPKRAPRLCPGCRQLITDTRCPDCTPAAYTSQQHRRRHPSRVNARAWRRLRLSVFAEQEFICVNPDERDDCTTLTEQLDHIIAITAGGTDDRDNLQGLCTTCHRAKTQRESQQG